MLHNLAPAAVEWLRSTSIEQRIQMMQILNNLGRKMLADETRQRHPEWNEEQVMKEVARRLLADDHLPELYATDYRQTGIFDHLNVN